MQILAAVIVGWGIFFLGRAYEAHRLRSNWQEVEEEWLELAREKRKWLFERSQN